MTILPAISKIFEKLLFYQIDNFIETKLTILQCGFRKENSAQHCLVVMLEKWRRTLDKRGCSGVPLTDLSRAFDCLSQDLIIAKIEG